MIKYIGLCLFVFSVYLISRGYREHLMRRALAYLEISELLIHIKERFATVILPLDELCSGYSGKLIGAQVIDAVGQRRDVSSELLGIGVSSDDAVYLSRYFESFGRATLADERQRLGEISAKYKQKSLDEEAESERGVKLSVVLSATLSAALLLLCL